ncbi:UNVERIFIED_CONTAM: hypothetical protein GTU68_027342 [Idotea baltica]|nr:hypothetical protein [Idotea baltica]
MKYPPDFTFTPLIKSFNIPKGNSPPLPWKQRLSICEGTAEGIVYLHTKFSPPLVHRDVKSPNILLDENFIPKLGDFGIVRLGGRGSANTVIQTTPVGTQMYMAPEAFRGDVSVKMDTFSFAIVSFFFIRELKS